MQQSVTPEKFDILIIGAGPAGSTCALQLKNSGLKVGLIDKATFPRDKVCGDAIPGRAVAVLRSISPALAEEMEQFPKMCFTSRTGFFIHHYPEFEVQWHNDAYTCPRLDFDNKLVELVKQHTHTTLLEGIKIDSVERKGETVVVGSTKAKKYWETRLLIGGDGAHSVASKYLTSNKMSHHDYGGAVRAYYEQVEGMESNKTEVYTLKDYIPGYFWAFPLSDGKVNVGFGMLSESISKNRVNLKTALHDFITASPILAKKFKNSRQLGKIQGFGLPFGSRRVEIVGDNYMLIGDAAALIDPVTGDGIGNAMLSGKLAAERAVFAYHQNNFSEKILKQYEIELFKKIGKELHRRTLALRLGTNYPFVLNLAGRVLQVPVFKRLAHWAM